MANVIFEGRREKSERRRKKAINVTPPPKFYHTPSLNEEDVAMLPMIW